MTLHHHSAVAEGLCVTAICMISVQYTAIRPINYPVNHETRVLLLHTDCERVCVCVCVCVCESTAAAN